MATENKPSPIQQIAEPEQQLTAITGKRASVHPDARGFFVPRTDEASK